MFSLSTFCVISPINEVAKMFKRPVVYLNKRPGKDMPSALTKFYNNMREDFGKINLKDYTIVY